MNIKEIALKHAREYLTFKLGGRKGLDVEEIVCDDEIYKEIVYELAQQFEALIAEVAKQNEPVSWARYQKFTGSTQRQEVVFKKPDDLHNWVCLYTIPPTAEQIANETAEACALTYLEDYDLTDIAERVRAGEWRKFVKEV